MYKLKRFLPLLALLLWLPVAADDTDAMGNFLEEAFPQAQPEPHVVWLTGERKQVVARILGHNYGTAYSLLA